MRTCFGNSKLNYAPLIEATLKNPLGDRSVKLTLLVDTGFQGGVLIPLHTYLELGLNLLEELKTTARTAVGGEVELRVSRVTVEMNGKTITCHAYTTLGVEKPLLGREALKELGLLYKPPKKLIVGLNSEGENIYNQY